MGVTADPDLMRPTYVCLLTTNAVSVLLINSGIVRRQTPLCSARAVRPAVAVNHSGHGSQLPGIHLPRLAVGRGSLYTRLPRLTSGVTYEQQPNSVGSVYAKEK